MIRNCIVFFLSGDVTTELLSQNTFAAPSIGIPNILNLYRIDSIMSTQILIVMNSDPNMDDSTVFCALLYHCTGAELRYINMPVCDLLVRL
jgi:hypothetical protein